MKNILAVDGGGIKSYIPLRILNYIENKTQIPIAELFDYFYGVSAGAFIISWLLIKDENNKPKYSTNKLLEVYEDLCKKIFPQVFANRFNNVFGFFGSKYDSTIIKESLYEIFQDIKIKDLLKPITISTYDLITGKPSIQNV